MQTKNTLNILILLFLPFLASSQTKWNIVDALPQEDIIDLVIKGDTMWASSGAVVYVSYDGGFGWANAGDIDESIEEIYTLHVDNESNNIVYVGTLGQGIFVSKDGGFHWEAMNQGLNGFATRIVDIIERRDTLYIGTDGAGVYFRPQNAAQWQPFNDGLGSNIAYGASTMLATDQALYLGAGGSGYLYHRANGANAWSFVEIQPYNYTLTALSFVETNGYILTSTVNGIYRSTNRGQSWQRFGSGFSEYYSGTAHYKLDKSGNELFLTINVPNFNAYLFRSTDGGANWQFLEEFVEGYGYVAGSTKHHIFLATQRGLWYTANDIISDDNEIPVNRSTGINIENIYPNPIENQMNVKLTLQQKTNVTAAILDVLGRQVAVLYNDELPAGEHTFNWQAPQMPAGTYQLMCKTSQGVVAKPIIKTK